MPAALVFFFQTFLFFLTGDPANNTPPVPSCLHFFIRGIFGGRQGCYTGWTLNRSPLCSSPLHGRLMEPVVYTLEVRFFVLLFSSQEATKDSKSDKVKG